MKKYAKIYLNINISMIQRKKAYLVRKKKTLRLMQDLQKNKTINNNKTFVYSISNLQYDLL